MVVRSDGGDRENHADDRSDAESAPRPSLAESG